MKYNISNLEYYIKLKRPTKQFLILLIFLISIPSILFGICDPFIPYIFDTLISIVVVTDLFAIFILFDVEKWQKLYYLFIGIYSLNLSIVLYISFFKLTYWILKIKTPLLFVLTIFIYIFILVIGSMLLLKALKTGYFSYTNMNNKKIKYRGVVTMSGAGLYITRLLQRNTSNYTFTLIGAFVYLLLSYFMFLGIHNIYKYYLIKRYEIYIPVDKFSKKKTK